MMLSLSTINATISPISLSDLVMMFVPSNKVLIPVARGKLLAGVWVRLPPKPHPHLMPHLLPKLHRYHLKLRLLPKPHLCRLALLKIPIPIIQSFLTQKGEYFTEAIAECQHLLKGM